MTQPQHDDTLLHRYHDGELSPEEAASLEAALAEDSESKAKLDALQELGSLLRSHASAVQAPDADELFAAIESEIDSEGDTQGEQETSTRPPLRVSRRCRSATPTRAPPR